MMLRVAATGDPLAFAVVVDRWSGAIQRLATCAVGDPHRGEDLTQEILARLYLKRSCYRPSAPFSHYLFRIALNLCRDEMRRNKRRQRLCPRLELDNPLRVLDNIASNELGPDARVMQSEESEIVRAALLGLPETYRLVLVLRFFEGLKRREIAHALGVPLGTVNSRMAAALARLTSSLHKIRFSAHLR